MLFKKIFPSFALVFMTSLVACGDDSSSNAGDSSDSKDNNTSSSSSAEMVSCDLPHDVPEFAASAGCIEFEKGSLEASALSIRCEDHDGTLGTGCPAEKKKKKKNEGNQNEGSENHGNCIDKSQCDAIVRGDFSTWHFVRADAFGEPTTYTYSVDGSKLILDIDGKVNENSYSFYDMTKEASQEMAFLAVRSTCEDGMEIEGANYCE